MTLEPTTPRNPTDPALVAIDQSLVRWRERLTTTILWCLTAASAISYSFSLVQQILPWGHPIAIAATLSLLAAAYARRVDLRLRIAVMFIALLVACLLPVAAVGIAPNTLTALSVGVVLAGLLVGPRAGMAFVAVSVAALLSIAHLHHTGVLTAPIDWYTRFDIRVPSIAWRMTLVFGALTTGLMVSVCYMLARTEWLLRRNANSLDSLQREQAAREQVQRELAQRQAAFQKAGELEALGRLAGYAAHDFNNALLVIQCNADIARASARVPEVIEALDAITTASRQAAGTSRQLRAFRPQPARDEQPLSLARETERTVRLLQALLPSNITLHLSLEDERKVVAEEGELQRIVTNLALNARDAMREGGSLALRVFAPSADDVPAVLDRARHWLALEVKDTGHGMDAATAAQIFEPFFTTKGDAGTGLGLASVRDLVRLRGGDVIVASAVDAGTCVRVYWSLAEVNAVIPAAAKSITPASGTVMVVDDDAAVRHAIARSLDRAGFVVLQGADGADAIQTSRRHQGAIDILLTDASLPGMPIVQLLSQFRSDFPSAGVILCSGYARDGVVEDQSGFDAFLPKPFEPQALVDAVSSLIAARRC